MGSTVQGSTTVQNMYYDVLLVYVQRVHLWYHLVIGNSIGGLVIRLGWVGLQLVGLGLQLRLEVSASVSVRTSVLQEYT